jgi:hypothetical protein
MAASPGSASLPSSDYSASVGRAEKFEENRRVLGIFCPLHRKNKGDSGGMMFDGSSPPSATPVTGNISPIRLKPSSD